MKRDQAAKIADRAFTVDDHGIAIISRKGLATLIRRYGGQRAKEERERCVMMIDGEKNRWTFAASKRGVPVVCDDIIKAIRKEQA